MTSERTMLIICSARSMRLPSSIKRQPTPRTILSCISPDRADSAVTSGSSASSGAEARSLARDLSSSSRASRRSLITRMVSVDSNSLDCSALDSMALRVACTLPARVASPITFSSSPSGLASNSGEASINPGKVAVSLLTACSRIFLALGEIGSSPFSSTNTVRNRRREASARSP